MIYTLTLNPSLDYIIKVPDLVLGQTNRASYESIKAGGKGINVSIVLHNLSIPSRALGFVAGFTGEEIERRIKLNGINSDMIHVQNGLSRINCKLQSAQETEVNGIGPNILMSDFELLRNKLSYLEKDDVLVLSGSVPSSLPKDTYAKIIHDLKVPCTCIVDATGESLLSALPAHPFLIKPNKAEMEELCSTEINNINEVISCMKSLQKKGARNIITSLGKDGAVMLTENNSIYHCYAKDVTAVNTVGAGDSLVAGFIASYFSNFDYKTAFRYAVTCATASACSLDLVTEKDIAVFNDKIAFNMLLS